METERDLGDGNSEFVSLIRKLHPVVFVWQDFSQKAKRGPVIIVHHDTPQSPSPGSLGAHHLFGERYWQWSDGLNRKSSREASFRVCLIKLLCQGMCRRSFVHTNKFVEVT